MLRDVQAIKEAQSRHYFDLFGGVVAHGPFRGFRMQWSQWWSQIDMAPKLFGLYEKEVADRLVALSRDRNVFIDIGAADGYFGVAAVSQGHYQTSHCFEIEEAGRRSIAKTAATNDVSDRIVIHGEASLPTLQTIPSQSLAEAVVLIDIEGAEFSFLDEDVLSLLANCPMIIELHDWLLPDGDRLKAALLKRIDAHFEAEIFQAGPRDLSEFAELENLPDTERWLICAEGRGRSMEWLALTPK